LKRIIVLVGPKGAGKSTIGHLIENWLGVPFIRVEPIYLQVRGVLGAEHPDLERHGFTAILGNLTQALTRHDVICFETTGASTHTSWLLAELSKVAEVLLVQVRADPSQCLARIHRRDASVHIPVSDNEVERINAVANQVDLPWAAVIDNRGNLEIDKILEIIAALLCAPLNRAQTEI
jgi:shikimate kinase